MSKIIGNTTATSNPQSDWAQTDSTKANYIKNKPDYDGSIAEILSRLDALEYVPIAINVFNNSAVAAEIGSTVNAITFTWSLNKTPTSLTFNGKSIDVASTSYSLSSANIAATKPDEVVTAGTLVAADEKKSVSKSTTITFMNRVYYGAAANGTVDSSFILSLTRSLQSSKAQTFSVTAGSSQYIWYAVPTRYGACTFNVGGFDGGFTLVNTISFTNASGYTENYYVYRSDNANLGTQTVKVS